MKALAYNVKGMFEGIAVCTFDARRAQVYAGVFHVGKDGVKRVREDTALSADELMASLEGEKERILLLGDGSALCYNNRERCPACKLPTAPSPYDSVRGASVALLGCEKYESGETVNAHALSPSYLRLSQAEREGARD